MTTRLRALAVLCAAATLMGAGMRGNVAAGDRPPGAPTGLRVDEATAPLWVTGAPTFGWIPSDPDRGEIQTAYRIVVDLQPRNPTLRGRRIWDSGRVESGAEAFVPAPGLHLEPDRSYTWTVQTWDRAGTSGPFASPASFDTSLDDRDWFADWIRRSSPPTNRFEDYFLVRRKFVVGATPVVRARAYVAAGQQYALYVNGTRVGGGPSYSYPDEQYYQATDIAKYLQPGAPNVIAMVVHNLGGGQGRPEEPP
ncbi:MAG TPA: alpha-L-rhamnosidase, partial [Acidimicrobiia bacterium]